MMIMTRSSWGSLGFSIASVEVAFCSEVVFSILPLVANQDNYNRHNHGEEAFCFDQFIKTSFQSAKCVSINKGEWQFSLLQLTFRP
jgi:hypothetical protein